MRLGLSSQKTLALWSGPSDRQKRMFSPKSNFPAGLLWAAAFTMLPLGASAQRTLNFSDLSLSPESYYNGADDAGGFSSGGAFFNNAYTYYEEYNMESWGGWAYSNVSDTVTPGYTNQYAAITGSGIGPNGIYAVAYMDTFTPTIPRIFLPEGEWLSSIQITNTTYAYRTMLEGDINFGVPAFGQGDYFYLTITGFNASDASTGSVNFYLADFTSEDASAWHIVNEWVQMDLSNSFGAETRALEFTLTSSDPGVPTYFALGEATVIPEPGTYALWGGLLAGVAVLGRRYRRTAKTG